MADNQILEAINGIKTSVAAMETQMRNVPSKEDLGAIVTEIRGVRETVIRNTDRIDSLFDLRKNDEKILSKRVEKLVEDKLATVGSTSGSASTSVRSNDIGFFLSRRSMRIWPVIGVAADSLGKGAITFFKNVLKVPEDVLGGIVIEKVQPVSQPRRSKIHNEVLVRLANSHQRDVIQSYAFNLAAVQGKAGIRLDVPDHLRGLFRQFESHAADLRARYGQVKRAVRFDDVLKSLYMDVKLDDTDWHRISVHDMEAIQAGKKSVKGDTSVASYKEKKKVLMLDGNEKFPEVPSEEEESSDSTFQDANQ